MQTAAFYIITEAKEMENRKEVKRGEIYYANLCPIVGSEQGGIRPVLILQNDRGNRNSPTTIVAAMTGQKKKRQRTHVTVSGCGLSKTTLVLLEQVRTIDKSRLRSYIGTLDDSSMEKIDRAIVESFGIKYLEGLRNEKRENCC